MQDSERFVGRELRAADFDAVQQLIAGGPRDHTLFLEPLLRAARAGDPEVWWYGALAGGTQLRALMGIRGHAAVVYGQTDAAVAAMAREALKAQGLARDAGAHRHQLFGEAGTIGRFWAIFQAIGRQVVIDRPRPLFAGAPELEPPSKRAAVRVATAADQKLVSELTAEHALEALGYDPRRANRAAHEARVTQVVAAGRQLVAEQDGKPVLVAEVTHLDDRTALLERVFVPRPSRALQRLVGGALVQATRATPVGDREVRFFAEVEGLADAATKAGFPRRADWHMVVMLG